MFTFQATGYVATQPKEIVPASGNKFYSFELSVKKRGKKEEEPSTLYISCAMDMSKKNVAKIMSSGKKVFVSGVIYDLQTFFSERKQQEIVKPKASVHHVDLISFPVKKPEEEVEEKPQIVEEDNAWTV